jgi:hypothetical protein
MFFAVLLAVFVSIVGGAQLQVIICKGRTNYSFHYLNQVMTFKQRKMLFAVGIRRCLFRCKQEQVRILLH